jgi:hypothetical protein
MKWKGISAKGGEMIFHGNNQPKQQNSYTLMLTDKAQEW